MEFMWIFSVPVSKVLIINGTMQVKMCVIAHQNVIWLVWITSHQFEKLMSKLQVQIFVTAIELLHSLNFVGVRILVTVQDAPYTPVRHA
jgi:hypothetical protein